MRQDWLAAGLVAIILAVAYGATLAPSISWANHSADSGDLVAAAAVMGVAHPSGYPTYLLLARLFQLIPLGDLAYRTNLLSATAALLSATVVFAIVRALSDRDTWPARAAAGTAALSCGLAPLIWSQAVVAEVYTLNALFAALLLWFSLLALRGPARSSWQLRRRGLVAGLALGNHLTIGLLVAAWLAALAAGPRQRAGPAARAAALGNAALGIGLGALVYLYLPLRAAAQPAINWGGADSWAGFWWALSGAAYHDLVFRLPAAELRARATELAALLLAQFGSVGLSLGLFGLLYSGRAERRFIGLSAAAAAGYALFASGYDSADAANYLIPAMLIVAIWIGAGIGALLAALPARRPARAGLAGLTLAALLLVPAVASISQVDASRDTRATSYANAVLAAAPPGAILFGATDRDSFPLWYRHYALGERPDVAVLVDPLLDFAWYRRNLRATYPSLSIPEATADDWPSAIGRANGPAHPICLVDASAADPLSCR